VEITTPKLWLFDGETNTQVYADLPASTELKTYLLTHSLSLPQAKRLGVALGKWTKAFHVWGAAPEQAALRGSMEGNKAMRELKYTINYTTLVATIANFAEILEESRDVFESVAKVTRDEMDGEEGVLIHGDFWSGK
jgi:hypothetical protein